MASKVAPLVWINGFPGAGKLTVATALAELDKTVIVIDNHRLIDPVEAKFPRSHPIISGSGICTAKRCLRNMCAIQRRSHEPSFSQVRRFRFIEKALQLKI